MARCFGDGDDLYADYHDHEWAQPPTEFGAHEAELFERLSLEVFQVGLSWILILRRRESFREAFARFDPQQVAKFGATQVARLAENPGIIRNRRKIEATISNAQALLQMHQRGESLAALIAHHRPPVPTTRWENMAQVPAFTTESAALTAELKTRGFKFVGPTNVYAMMQALGVVDDHLATCPVGTANPLTTRAPDIWDEVREGTSLKG